MHVRQAQCYDAHAVVIRRVETRIKSRPALTIYIHRQPASSSSRQMKGATVVVGDMTWVGILSVVIATPP